MSLSIKSFFYLKYSKNQILYTTEERKPTSLCQDYPFFGLACYALLYSRVRAVLPGFMAGVCKIAISLWAGPLVAAAGRFLPSERVPGRGS